MVIGDIAERRLGRGLAAGEDGSWDRLYDVFGERVFRLLQRLTGDPVLAEDLTHDTFVRLWERRGQFDPGRSVGGWIFRIATNLARDRFRRADYQAQRHSEPVEDRADPARAAIPELRIALRRALSGLSEDQRVTLLLHDVDGFTHEEIGEMLDIAPGSSKARVHRTRALLYDLLKREDVS